MGDTNIDKKNVLCADSDKILIRRLQMVEKNYIGRDGIQYSSLLRITVQILKDSFWEDSIFFK